MAQNTQHLPLHHPGTQRREGVRGAGGRPGRVEEGGGGGEAVKNGAGGREEGTRPYLCKPFVAVDCKTGQDSLE